MLAQTAYAWLAVVGFDFLLHAGLLARLYAQPSPFLLPAEDAFGRLPAGYLAFVLAAALLVWLAGRAGIAGWRPGLLFGLQVGALTWGGLALALWSITTAGPALLVAWFAGQTAEWGLAGAVIGVAAVTERPRRLLAAILLFDLAAVIITVILQSIGFAPAARVE
jgi:hypothetical protein